jgi:putative copper export protein
MSHVVIEWLVLAGFVALTGGLFFEALVLRGDRFARLREVAETARLRWLSWALILSLIATPLVLIVQDARFDDGRVQWLSYARLAILIGLMALLRARNHTGLPALLLALLLLATQSLLGRSAIWPDGVAQTIGDWGHLTLAVLWLGGVAMLAVIGIEAYRANEPQVFAAFSRLTDRFSPFAVFCVIGLTLGGVAQAAQYLTAPEALWTTDYGRTLLIKLAISAVAIALGGIHQQVVAPRLRLWVLAGEHSGVNAAAVIRRYRVTLWIEVIVAVSILLVVGALRVTSV